MLPIASLILLGAGLASSGTVTSSIASLLDEIERDPHPCQAFCRNGMHLVCKDFNGYSFCDHQSVAKLGGSDCR
ncbi:hypothetical protein GQ602_005196 [Ophiocordyceps camponoti-floridani]|uniref:Extracellular membrane protein CFEM domain-containing protein n=1 Tax=Ophiocordyceps camponoti-floridani TaxID=2030778 RepID=A0A8H4Q5A0_9HYPO|nr:hypothetical protein GQ602_005196 [Ophiocordyceps camponoti-floridani]